MSTCTPYSTGSVVLLPRCSGGKRAPKSGKGDADKDGFNSRGGRTNSVLDAETVYTYIGMQDLMEENTQVTVEVLNEDNIMYLDPTRWFPSTDDASHKLSPVYAASRAFTARALDTLIAQAYYQPHVLQVGPHNRL